MNSLVAIQQATLAARQRTGDNSLGVEVEAGRFRVVSVTYLPNGESLVIPLTASTDLTNALRTLQNFRPRKA